MKKVLFTLLISLNFILIYAQWEPTYIIEHTQVNEGSTVNSSCIHNGWLYAATSIPFQPQLWKSDDEGESWTEVPYPEHVGWFSHMISVGNRLYIANYNNWYAKSMIWYSEDQGETWSVDTAGMPGAGDANGGAYVVAMHGWEGHLIATFGGADLIYMKSFDEPWELVSDLTDTDPNVYTSRGNTIFAFKEYSTDFGQTWIYPANNGLSPNLAPFDSYATDERVYISGANFGNNIIYYTADNGENWNEIDLGDWNGRAVRTIYAKNDHLWLALDNDQTGTSSDIIYSSDGGTTFTDFSEGLPEDPFGTYYVHTIMYNDNMLFAVNNFMDIYKRPVDIGSNIISADFEKSVSIWPNPAKDMIRIESDLNFVTIGLSDLQGKKIQVDYTPEKVLNINSLKPGIYIIKLVTRDGSYKSQLFIKE